MMHGTYNITLLCNFRFRLHRNGSVRAETCRSTNITQIRLALDIVFFFFVLFFQYSIINTRWQATIYSNCIVQIHQLKWHNWAPVLGYSATLKIKYSLLTCHVHLCLPLFIYFSLFLQQKIYRSSTINIHQAHTCLFDALLAPCHPFLSLLHYQQVTY